MVNAEAEAEAVNAEGALVDGILIPAQMQQRMMENAKEQLEITDEAEWKAVQPLVQKVMDARRATMSGIGRGMFGGARRGGPQGGGDSAPAADQQNRRGGGMFGQPSPEAEALQKAVDAKAPKAELKAAVAKYQEARKAKQAELEQAQDALRKVLTARQEAIATVNGWLLIWVWGSEARETGSDRVNPCGIDHEPDSEPGSRHQAVARENGGSQTAFRHRRAGASATGTIRRGKRCANGG
jgi:hypothetical protein